MNKIWRSTRTFPRDAASKIREVYKLDPRPGEEIESKSGFTKEELDEVKDVFRYFDRDRNKHLDRKECQCLFKHQIGSELDKTSFDKVFGRMDTNRDGNVSFPEYLQHLSSRKKKLPSNYQLEDYFYMFDKNQDGLMNLEGLRHALLFLGEDAGRSDLRSVFVRHDNDRDGLITKTEFQDLLHENFPR